LAESSATEPDDKFGQLELIGLEHVEKDGSTMRSELRRRSNGKIIRVLYGVRGGSMAFSADEIIVGLKDGADSTSALGAFSPSNIRHINANTVVVKLSNLSYVTLTDTLEEFNKSEHVRYAEKNYVVSSTLSASGIGAQSVPNDPGVQWHLNQTNDADIDAYEAWPVISSAGNLKIAILDTGVRRSHQDILPNFNTNIQYDFAYGDGIADDVDGHGTHVAGIAAAQGDNGFGGTGVAQDAEIIAGKVLDNNGNGVISDIVAGMNWAISEGAKVLNLSIGSTSTNAPRQQSIADALMNARDAKVIVVFAAGNLGINNDQTDYYPADFSTEFDNVITVASSTESDLLAGSSNYGFNSVNVAAPGTNIYSTYNIADNSYALDSGTSMAAPIVAGMAALIEAHFVENNPAKTIQRIENSVDYKSAFEATVSSKGRVNLRRSLSLFSLKPTSAGTTGTRWGSSTIQWIDDTNAPWFWSFRIGEWFYTSSTDLEDIWLYSNTNETWYYTRSSYFPGAFKDGSVWVNLENEF
jgi:subtilisin family serine protease